MEQVHPLPETDQQITSGACSNALPEIHVVYARKKIQASRAQSPDVCNNACPKNVDNSNTPLLVQQKEQQNPERSVKAYSSDGSNVVEVVVEMDPLPLPTFKQVERIRDQSRQNSKQNFAWRLMPLFFREEEMLGRNCRGWLKAPLNPDTLESLRNAVFEHWAAPTPKIEQSEWRKCEQAIDKGLRTMYRKSKGVTETEPKLAL
jgi:hypothetical protein